VKKLERSLQLVSDEEMVVARSSVSNDPKYSSAMLCSEVPSAWLSACSLKQKPSARMPTEVVPAITMSPKAFGVAVTKFVAELFSKGAKYAVVSRIGTESNVLAS